jgi:hypothetical protein
VAVEPAREPVVFETDSRAEAYLARHTEEQFAYIGIAELLAKVVVQTIETDSRTDVAALLVGFEVGVQVKAGAAEAKEATVSEGEVVVLVEVVVEWHAAVIEAAVAVEFAVEDATVAAVAVAVGYNSKDTVDTASWPRDTYSVCHSHRMGMAEDRHYCTVSAGEFVRVGTAAAVYNAGTGRTQVVGSSSPRDIDTSHTTLVCLSQTRDDDRGFSRFGPDKPPGGQLIRDHLYMTLGGLLCTRN